MQTAPSPTPKLRAFWVEVPRGAFLKRDRQGHLDFVAPLPCPFNYGSDPETPSADGEGVDVVVLGRRRGRGDQGRLPLRGRVCFVDQGLQDDKLILSERPLRRRDILLLRCFFLGYGVAKAALATLRGRPRPTHFQGLMLEP